MEQNQKKQQKQQSHGQFLEIRVTENLEPLLRRPISIHQVEGNIIEFIFQVKGKGTEILKEKKEGEEIDIIGPLGKGTFNSKNKKNIAIIGGGIGIFPLYELAKRAKKETNVNMYLGFRSKDFVVLEAEFKKVSNNFILTTDDGSYGNKGFAINFLKEDIKKKEIDRNICMWTTSNVKSSKRACGKRKHTMSNIIRRKNGVWNRCVPGMCSKTKWK